MVLRKYLINLIVLYGLINAINSANGKLFDQIRNDCNRSLHSTSLPISMLDSEVAPAVYLFFNKNLKTSTRSKQNLLEFNSKKYWISILFPSNFWLKQFCRKIACMLCFFLDSVILWLNRCVLVVTVRSLGMEFQIHIELSFKQQTRNEMKWGSVC